jgi:hypothetical protein
MLSNFSWFWYLFILRAKQLTTKPLGQKANHLKQSTFLINQVLMCIYRKQTFAFAKARATK